MGEEYFSALRFAFSKEKTNKKEISVDHFFPLRQNSSDFKYQKIAFYCKVGRKKSIRTSENLSNLKRFRCKCISSLLYTAL